MAIHPPTAVNVHRHESEYIKFIITIFDKIIATWLLACMFWRCCILYSSYFYQCIHMEKEEKRKGNWLVPMGTVLILYSHHTRIVQVQVRGPKTEYLVDYFHWVAPWFERWSFIASEVVLHVFEYTFCLSLKKGVCYCRYSCK